MNYIFKEHSLIMQSLFPGFLTPFPLEPSLPLRKMYCQIQVSFISFRDYRSTHFEPTVV